MPRPSNISALHHSPRLVRTTIARGLAAGDRDDAGNAPAVDEKGGDQGAGIIRGMAILTRGEALGHGLQPGEVPSTNSAQSYASGEFWQPSKAGSSTRQTDRRRAKYVIGVTARLAGSVGDPSVLSRSRSAPLRL